MGLQTRGGCFSALRHQ